MGSRNLHLGVMHVSATSPGVRPPGTPGDLSKTPNKAYLIPWGMEQEKVTKFPHPRVPKEVRERTVHVKLWKTFIFNCKLSKKHISSFSLLVLWWSSRTDHDIRVGNVYIFNSLWSTPHHTAAARCLTRLLFQMRLWLLFWDFPWPQ